MTSPQRADRPLGVYLVALYFVLSGFLEAIYKLRKSGSHLPWSPFAEHSVWHLASDIVVYLALAFLVWHLTWLGRLAALVFGYLYLATCLWFFFLYARGTQMNSTPLFAVVSAYHLVTLPFLLYYMQREPSKRLFQASLLEILLPRN